MILKKKSFKKTEENHEKKCLIKPAGVQDSEISIIYRELMCNKIIFVAC